MIVPPLTQNGNSQPSYSFVHQLGQLGFDGTVLSIFYELHHCLSEVKVSFLVRGLRVPPPHPTEIVSVLTSSLDIKDLMRILIGFLSCQLLYGELIMQVLLRFKAFLSISNAFVTCSFPGPCLDFLTRLLVVRGRTGGQTLDCLHCVEQEASLGKGKQVVLVRVPDDNLWFCSVRLANVIVIFFSEVRICTHY